MVRMSRILLTIMLIFVAGESFAAKLDQFVDPMRPLHYQTSLSQQAKAEGVTTKDWTLTAVLISAERSVAVINGKTLQQGETIGGYRLVKIMPDKVLLKNGQRKLVLRRTGTGLKKMSPSRDIEKGSKP